MVTRLALLLPPLLLLPLGLPAQETPPPGREDKSLAVYAQALPTPALRYALLPEVNEQRTGNVVQCYLKCFMEQNNFYHNEQVLEERQKHLETPLAELPRSLTRGYGGRMLRYADEAARMTVLDWQANNDLRQDGMAALVPETQVLRSLANALLVRLRLELRDREFDAALGTLKTLNALACHVKQHPTLIGGLVGLAITSQTLNVLREWQQQPGAPNLFWALQRAQQPLIEMRVPWEGERWFAMADIKTALAPEKPLVVDELPKFLQKYQVMVAILAPREGQEVARVTLAQFLQRSQQPAEVAAAKQRLLTAGTAAELLDKLPPIQVILLDEFRRYEAARDDLLKWTQMPYWQAEAGLRETMERIKKEEPSVLLSLMLPVVAKVRHSQLRMEQMIVMQLHVEALRHYAASHEGRWPEQLSAIGLPLPPDPVTGQPLKYSTADGKAVLETTPPRPLPGLSPVRLHHRWEITLARP